MMFWSLKSVSCWVSGLLMKLKVIKSDFGVQMVPNMLTGSFSESFSFGNFSNVLTLLETYLWVGRLATVACRETRRFNISN